MQSHGQSHADWFANRAEEWVTNSTERGDEMKGLQQKDGGS